jgi:hypothetical protein
MNNMMSCSEEVSTRELQASSSQLGVGRLCSLLLEAWHDRVAGVAAYSGAITSVAFSGDGHRLVIADEDRKLKVGCSRVHSMQSPAACA